MSELRYVFRGDISDPQNMNEFVRYHLGNMCYISKMPESLDSHIIVGTWDDEIVVDSVSNNPRLHIVPKPDIFRGYFQETEQGVTVAVFPSREDISKEMNASRSKVTENSENTLLRSIGSKILNIPSILNQMNPIISLLDGVLNTSSISVDDFKDTGNLMRYVEFLEDLQIIRVENDLLVPGRIMDQSLDDDMSDGEIYTALLDEIVGKGYTRMFTELHMTHLQPYIRMTNANCMTSLLEDEPLKWNWKLYGQYLDRIYSMRRMKKGSIVANATQLNRAGIMESHRARRVDTMYSCKRDIFDDYSVSVRRAGVRI